LRQGDVLGDAPPPPRRVLRAETVAAAIASGSPFARTPTRPARYAIGDKVRTIAAHPQHHTRLPAYARGKLGVIERVHGAHVFPDSNARGLGESPQWLYTVAFDEEELWGKVDAKQRSSLSIDAFEPYLEPA
jgi:nitrile hydratase subunit beta